MRKLLTVLLVLSFVVIVINGCSKKSGEPAPRIEENGLTREINDFVPPSLLAIIDSLGMPINRGGNPPNIGGSYKATPFKLINSNRSGDIIGSIYADYYVKFSYICDVMVKVPIKMNDMKATLPNKDRIESFIYAGNARFTLHNKETGNRFTYEFRKPKEKRGSADLWFVSVLTSPDRYTFIGTSVASKSQNMFGNVHSYHHSCKSSITRNAQSVRTIMWFIKALDENRIPSQVEVWHEGRCGKCGRPLTVPESIESGLGPICANKEL